MLLLTTWAAQHADAQSQDPAKLWGDFNHYVLIARPELALGIGNALLSVEDQQLLDIVEASTYTNYETTLFRASKIDTLKEVSEQLQGKIHAARLARSREPARIEADILKLSEGERANLNATQRLKAAGQYAIPALINALRDERQKRQHPYIIAVLVAIGRPAVYPLSVSLPKLEPVQQGQIAQILAEIGYPRALPYIKDVIENPKTDASARDIASAAHRHLAKAAGVSEDIGAAELYLTLAQNHYDVAIRNEELPGFAPADNRGMVWKYEPNTGLVADPVPDEIYGYVLAMRASHRALQLQPTLSSALSLWLTANLTRENRLPANEKDVSYTFPRPGSYYLEMAGPLRQHDVLKRALDDFDSVLALDAIEALNATAGTDALVNREGTSQPLIRALSFPDRRVRFRAAFAMTNARPTSPFPGSHRIVPVLAEAVRQTESRYAVVIAHDEKYRRDLAASLREDLGWKVISGGSLAEVAQDVGYGPGVDLVVSRLDLDSTIALQHQRATDYKLAAAPLLAMMESSADLSNISYMFPKDQTIFAVLSASEADKIKLAIEQAVKTYAGAPMDAAEATLFASTALTLLRDIALGAGGGGQIFNVTDAQTAMIQAINDDREEIVIKSATVLAMLDSADAQQAIADAALDITRPSTLRVELLNALADSARHIGNRLNEPQLSKLLDTVKASDGALALASARAHGALTLPTSNVVELIAK